MEDRVVLDGVLIKCNRNPSKINSDMDCLNARIAIERLAKVNELGEQKKHAEEFERIREQLRVSQDLKRQRREAAQKVDPYNLPVIPVDGAEGPPALIGQTKL